MPADYRMCQRVKTVFRAIAGHSLASMYEFHFYTQSRVAVLERDDICRIGRFLIQPAGWEEAGMDGKTIFYRPA
jgi:hypothetical protein